MKKTIIGLAIFTAALMFIPFTIPILAVAVGLFILYVLWIILTADSIKINMTEEQHNEQ